MTPRSIRRAQERKALKAARKAERFLAPEEAQPVEAPAPTTLRTYDGLVSEALCRIYEPSHDSPDTPLLFTPTPLSAAQLAANRANAQLSCGPTSPEGKATSSLNAVKTALTGRTVLLPSDDAAAYQDHLRAYLEDFRPVGQRESDLVQSIADTMWRLKRIPGLENALFAQGHIEFSAAFNQHEAALRSSMIEVQTFIKYEKQLRNLQLQESRLARRREKEMAELRQLQQERRSREQQALETVAKRYLKGNHTQQPFAPEADGFVFSTAQIEDYLEHHALRIASSFLANPAANTERNNQKAA